MRVTIIVLITIVVIEQMSVGVIGCGKNVVDSSTIAEQESESLDELRAREESEAKEKIKKLENNQTLVNGITFNMKDMLGEGLTGFVFKGKTRDGIKVAVKLFPEYNKSLESYSIELKCYEKMGATTGDECKKYGIPPILYHGPGATSKVLVLLLYSFTLKHLSESNITVLDEEWLSIMQYMVITIKYMHSKGVRHGDIHDQNIMIELNQVYLIDYGFNHFAKKQEAHDMLRMFLAMCNFFNIREFMREKVKMGLQMFRQKEYIIQRIIAKNVINSKYVRPLVDFGIEAVNANVTQRLPNYKKLHKILEDALYSGKDHSQRIIFNWLTDEQKAIARKMPIVNIESIQFNNV